MTKAIIIVWKDHKPIKVRRSESYNREAIKRLACQLKEHYPNHEVKYYWVEGEGTVHNK